MPRKTRNNLLFDGCFAHIISRSRVMESGEPVHYFIGIKFDKNKNQTIANFMTGISKEFRAIIPSNLYVDVIHLTEKDAPINNFIQNNAIPFYTKF